MLPPYDTVKGRLVRFLTSLMIGIFAVSWLPLIQRLFFTPAWLEYGTERTVTRQGVTRTYFEWLDAYDLEYYNVQPFEIDATRIVWPAFTATAFLSAFIAVIVMLALGYILEPWLREVWRERQLPCDGTGCGCIDHVFCKNSSCSCPNHKIEGWAEGVEEPASTESEQDSESSESSSQDEETPSNTEDSPPAPATRSWQPPPDGQLAETAMRN